MSPRSAPLFGAMKMAIDAEGANLVKKVKGIIK